MLSRLFKFLFENDDPRLADLFLVKSSLSVFTIIGLYIFFIKILGPKLMENRKPYKLENVIKAYNLFQVIMNFYIFYNTLMICKNFKIFKCNPADMTDSPEARNNIHMFYLYYINKYVDLLDTIFFVLRKKYNQISFLHVYHHSHMPFLTHLGMKVAPGGSALIPVLFNTFVHVLMYAYYFIAAMGPKYRKYLWWKKYMTLVQLIQFGIGFPHFLIVLFVPDSDCNLVSGFAYYLLANAIFFTLILWKFYKKEYKQKNLTQNKINKTALNNKMD